MKSLCVFDLDGTLIPYDSFGRLVRPLMWRRPALLVAAALRRAGVLSRAAFAERAHLAFRHSIGEEGVFDAIAEAIAADVADDGRALIRTWRERGGHLLLLSASPDEYVKPLARRLGFDEGHGSHWRGGRYRHLHGEEKRRFVDEVYAPSAWERAFAIADQDSDEPLLAEFIEARRVRTQAAAAGAPPRTL